MERHKQLEQRARAKAALDARLDLVGEGLHRACRQLLLGHLGEASVDGRLEARGVVVVVRFRSPSLLSELFAALFSELPYNRAMGQKQHEADPRYLLDGVPYVNPADLTDSVGPLPCISIPFMGQVPLRNMFQKSTSPGENEIDFASRFPPRQLEASGLPDFDRISIEFRSNLDRISLQFP